MHPDRFTRRGPACYGIEANVGVDLQGQDQRVIAVPRPHPDAIDPPPPAFHMPLVPAALVEDKVRLLRRLAAAGRLGLWALYVDTRPPHGWHAYLPPQWCGTQGVRANLSYPCVTVPGPQLRLAGTFQSAPPASPDELASGLPPFDGVHLYFHSNANWLVLAAYLTVAGEPYLVPPPGHVLSEPHDPDLAFLSQRLWGNAGSSSATSPSGSSSGT